METEQEDTEKKIPIKLYSNKELRTRLNITERTFRRMMAVMKSEVGERMGHFYTPKQVKIILEKLGKPFILIIGLAVKIFAGAELGHKDK
ncbi:MAG: hypothetical protein JST14_00745 [Bacteroidetes bacterium]|nr:hypothetical protein [Bacteroidota bacterium]